VQERENKELSSNNHSESFCSFCHKLRNFRDPANAIIPTIYPSDRLSLPSEKALDTQSTLILEQHMSKTDRKTVLSCIQPTGDMHLGNYFGAVKNWVDLQEQYECIYGVVDYHAMTMPYDVKKLRTNTWDLMINLVSVGVKPENLFVQSLVPEHAELGWIFNCFSSFGEVSRMTQFKDKSQKREEDKTDKFISTGLFDYPVLQAADILIYKADYVPVGKDQDQHLELSRSIAGRFNHQIGKEYFVMPEGLHTETPKIMSTADPLRKMSKSAGEKHYIAVFGDEARIKKQIRSAVTDTGEQSETMSPGVENLFRLMKGSGDITNHDQMPALQRSERKPKKHFVKSKIS